MPTGSSSSSTTRRALITGASSGIGEATAEAFAQAGFDVVLVARSAEKLTKLAKRLSESRPSKSGTSESGLSESGIDAKAFPIDLCDLAALKQKIVDIESTVGPIDVLVNSAGMGYTGRLDAMTLADWQKVMDLNVTSIFQMMQAVLPGMRQRAKGTIVNVASIAAQQPFENWGAYGVSKAALVALSDAVRVEEAANGIRIITISPGAVNTPIWDTDTVQADFDRSAMLDAQTVAQTILHSVLLPSNALVSSITLTPAGGTL